MQCSSGDGKPVFARGLCQGCYHRLRRRGTIERANVIKGTTCIHEGCDRPQFSKNLCPYHYQKNVHPLKGIWKNLRSRYPGFFSPTWERFEAFLADVGERPDGEYRLHRLDENLPFSKENCEWRPVVGSTRKDSMTKEERAIYSREWTLRDRFGIDGIRYAEMMTEQDGKCAICRQEETAIHHKTGAARSLAVDHDHKTGEVRGLLCRDCNTAIGLFDDDPDLLRSAIAYLDRHTEKP